MLNRILRQQRLRLPFNTPFKRRPNKVIEQKRAVDEQCETQDLEPLKSLPAKAQRYNPDEERATGIDGGARGCRDGAGYRETEEVEATRRVLIAMLSG